MPIARILCGLTLHIELYDRLDGPDAREAREAVNLAISIANATAPTPKKLNADPCDYHEETGTTRARPFFVLRNVAPISWSVSYNSFRKADEFECTIPLALLPVPSESIRSIVAYAVIRNVGDDDWAEGLERGSAVPQLEPDLGNADFAGICKSTTWTGTTDGIPTIKLPFSDFLGLLANKKVPPGVELNRKLKISKAVAEFLVGTPAEGLCVAWVDSSDEPTVDEHIPKAQKKKKGKSSAKPTKSGQSYLDVITEECSRLGCVARIDVTRLEISDAGPLYEGQLAATRAQILVGQIVESIEAEHQLIGVKTQAIQVVGYNPDTGDNWTARWPPDPKSVKAVQVEAGKPPRLPPLTANIGLPGYEQLDESVLLIPVGAVSNEDRLLKMAQMIFLERTRQRVKYTVKTHSPWSNPARPESEFANLLLLRAGDTVTFGYLASRDDDGALLPPAIRALTGEIGPEGVAQLLVASGVAQDVASRIGQVVASVPRLSLFRVDEMHVAGGEKQDAEITIKLVNFTQIVDDIQRSAQGQEAAEKVDSLAGRVAELAVATAADVKAAFSEAYQAIAESANAALTEKLDSLYQRVMRGR